MSKILNARDAMAITALATKSLDPWERLFQRIEEAASQGKRKVVFDYIEEGVVFTEPLKIIQIKLKELGYTIMMDKAIDKLTYDSGGPYPLLIIKW